MLSTWLPGHGEGPGRLANQMNRRALTLFAGLVRVRVRDRLVRPAAHRGTTRHGHSRRPPSSTRPTAASITALHSREDRVVLRYGQMPESIRDAAVAIEDRRFYWHHGVRPSRRSSGRAYEDAAAGQVVEGGSTITQQLVKNLYVGGAEPFRRKVDEAALAWQLEDRLSKREILTRYLNTVYFGNGAYGVEAAAETYFAESARHLSLSEARCSPASSPRRPLRPLHQPRRRLRASQRGPSPDGRTRDDRGPRGLPGRVERAARRPPQH